MIKHGLELGRRYVTRSGDMTGPIGEWPTSSPFGYHAEVNALSVKWDWLGRRSNAVRSMRDLCQIVPKPGELWKLPGGDLIAIGPNPGPDDYLPGDAELFVLPLPGGSPDEETFSNPPAQQKAEPGMKYDGGKPRMDLLPMDALLGGADVFTYGAEKYASRNWEKGMSWGRLIGGALRHLAAIMLGQDTDEESGKPHVDHLLCCVLMLSAHMKRGIGTDDRR